MFTGLIEEIGIVKSLTRVTVGKLVVASEKVIRDVDVGDSVSVSGVCLTVTSVGDGELSFDAVPETLARSALSELRPGDKVNLEASLRAGKMMGGHFVQGHVDGVGKVESIRSVGESWEISVSAPPRVLRYVVEKGSVAVDGISLTVASVDSRNLKVAVIPHTLSATTLHLKKVGDPVNLEADIIGKYVEKFVAERSDSTGVTEDALREAGFM
ncbi:MAG: riboflavin synthase subunit alpha [Armatimonadetes bacterium RBG_16_58_9]|nr:MAG: riboflavin synthase subunit alpha [Armatimonadetes bacterium RBG_16_58_9]